ncbi:MAG TPA: ABC transporter permease [Kofleriaceae bacterium]|nr:ABC transporter permease [Kofleriaceae bacterium]
MIGAAVRKEIQLVLRDRGTLISLFVMPLVFMGVLGSMFSRRGEEAEEPRAIAVYLDLGSARAAAAVRAIDASGLFRARREASPERVRRAVAGEEVEAGIVFPADFDPMAGRPGELVIDTAAPPAVRAPIEGALAGLVARSLAGVQLPPPLIPKSPPGIKPPLDASAFQLYVPGSAVLFGFFLALTVGISFVHERRNGTFRRLLAAPVRRPLLLAAKLVPYYLVGLAQMTFLFGLGVLAFGMEVGGSLLALALLTAAVVFAAVSLGLFIASFGGTERQVGAIGSVCLLVMGLLGGCMVPRMIMPAGMQKVGLFTPHAWALEGYQDVLVRAGTGVADVAVPIAAVAAFGLAFALAGSLRFDFER